MIKLCECGCGTTTKTRRGKYNRFINGHRSSIQPSGKNSHAWKGGIIRSKERVLIYFPDHHRSTCQGYVLRYILFVEKVMGKPLLKPAVIHHVDEVKNNDSNKNLIVCENDSYHALIHQRNRAYVACGHASWRKCSICMKYDDPKNLYIKTYSPKGGCVYHKKCKSDKQKKNYKLLKEL